MRTEPKQETRGLRRPLAVVGLSLFAAMLCLTLMGSVRAAVVLSVMSGAVFAGGLLCFRSRHPLFLCTASGAVLAGCLLFLLSWLLAVAPAERLPGEQVEISAVVSAFPERSENRRRYYVTARAVANGVRVPGKVRLSLPAGDDRRCDFAADLRPGDRVTFTGTLYVLGGKNADVQRSFRSRRLFLGAYPTKAVTLDPTERLSLWGRFLALREGAIRRLKTRFSGDVGGVLIALLFGEKSALSADSYRSFRDSGVAHLLAVSGMHLTLWVLLLQELLRRRGVGMRTAALVSMAVTVLVMAFAMFSGSVLRAGFMLLLYLFGAILHRGSDGLNSLGFASLVCLLLNPFLAGNVGFVLSVLSVFAMFAFAAPLSQRLLAFLRVKRPAWRRLLVLGCESVCVSACVSVVTAPVLIYAFGRVSLVSVLTNLLFLPLAAPLLVCAGVSLLLGGVPLLGAAVCTLTRLFALLALKLASAVSSLPFAAISCEKTHAVTALACTLCCFGLLGLILQTDRRGQRKKALAAALSALLVCCLTVPGIAEAGTVRLVMLQAGEGSCVFLQQGSDAALLQFDCDDYHADLAVDALEARGVTLRAAVLSGTPNDTLLLSRLSPETVILSAGAQASALPAGTPLSSSNTFIFGPFNLRSVTDGVLFEGRGHTFFLSDTHLLTASDGEQTIHTDAANARFSTAQDGLVLVCSKNGTLRLRGENNWHILMKKNSNGT